MSRSLAEQETVIRFDRASPVATLWTAASPVAGKWRRLGYPVAEDGHGWRADVPTKMLSFRRLGQKPPQGPKQAIPPGFARAKSLGRV